MMPELISKSVEHAKSVRTLRVVEGTFIDSAIGQADSISCLSFLSYLN